MLKLLRKLRGHPSAPQQGRSSKNVVPDAALCCGSPLLVLEAALLHPMRKTLRHDDGLGSPDIVESIRTALQIAHGLVSETAERAGLRSSAKSHD